MGSTPESSLHEISKFLAVTFLIGLLTPSLAQENVGVVFSPPHPTPNQSIQVCYRPDAKAFRANSVVKAKTYFASIGDPGLVLNPPVVQEIKLRYENGIYCGQLEPPPGTLSIMITFHDSLGHVDTNSGKGYWSPIYKGDQPMPGSYGSNANFFGETARLYDLEENKSYARSLYQDEFGRNPTLKRSFARRYLGTFDINDTQEELIFRQELTRFSLYPDLSEYDLLTVKRFYVMVGEPDSARKYDTLCIQRYPQGSWAIQVKSLPLAMEIDEIEDLDQKWKKYLEFKQLYGGNYSDAFTRRQMQNRMGQILRGMMLKFSERNDLATWEAEVNKLDEDSRFRTYYRTAAVVSEKLKKSIEIKGAGVGSFKPESPLWQTTAEEEQLLHYLERLARESSEWHRKHLEAPRDDADQVLFTMAMIKSIRALQLGYALDALAEILVLQQRPSEALEILREAVSITNYSEADINEHYVQLLVRNNHLDEAKWEASKIVRLEKSTASIHQFYKTAVKDSSAAVAQVNLEKRLKKEMLLDPFPDVSLVDEKGQTVALNQLRGKTIVLDFWATWCAPCIIGMGPLSTVAEQYKQRDDVVFMFVNTDKAGEGTRKKISTVLEELGYEVDVYYDPEFRTSKVLKVVGLPTLIIVDPKGKVRFRHLGLIPAYGKQQLVDEVTAMIELVR